jgi:hypothetical protein
MQFRRVHRCAVGVVRSSDIGRPKGALNERHALGAKRNALVRRACGNGRRRRAGRRRRLNPDAARVLDPQQTDRDRGKDQDVKPSDQLFDPRRLILEHDPEKWAPIFGKGLSPPKRGSCSTNKLKAG